MNKKDNNINFYPLRFTPIYKNYIWGGNRICTDLNRKKTPSPCAESWEIADHKDGISIVSNGYFKDYTLNNLIKEFKNEILGKYIVNNNNNNSEFPLLIKLIDAKERLSLQVHPDERAAKILSSQAKSELWYILKADHNSKVYAGLKIKGSAATRQIYNLNERAILENIIEHQVSAGDIVNIPGGCVHAIGEGCLILEIQQNSNTTYRIYDWGRQRKLHLNEAYEAINWQNNDQKIIYKNSLNNNYKELIKTSFCCLEKYELNENSKLNLKYKNSFQILFIERGNIILNSADNKNSYELQENSTWLIPAAMKNFTLIADKDYASFIRIMPI